MKRHYRVVPFTLCLFACGAAADAAHKAAKDAYTDEGIDCVTKYRPNKAAIDECREQVFIRWGKTPALILKDAGGDQ